MIQGSNESSSVQAQLTTSKITNKKASEPMEEAENRQREEPVVEDVEVEEVERPATQEKSNLDVVKQLSQEEEAGRDSAQKSQQRSPHEVPKLPTPLSQ